MKRRSIIAAAACALVAATSAWSQVTTFPTRAVSLIVPYAPGGLPDTVARVVGQRLGEKWGQPVVIENKPGGNGIVAAEYLANKPADGYTLLFTDNTMFTVNPWIYPKLPYDPAKGFTFISLTASAPLFLAVLPSIPANNFTEFVAHVKSKPGQLPYGSAGVGSIHQLTMESVKASLGIDILHVPYKGCGQAVPALVGGQVVAVFCAYPSLAGFAKEGKVKLLAVNSIKRSSLAPDIATIAETSIPGFDFAPKVGFSGPPGMAPALAQKIAADVAEVLKEPAMIERLRVQGVDPIGGGPDAYASLLNDERARMQSAVKLAGAKAD
jgi:tripartite-type tricarboxylate transporter receptor subunit TctC